MNAREHIRTIISGKAADRVGSWLGNPHPDTENVVVITQAALE